MSLLTANRWATVSARLRSGKCRRRPRTLLSSAPRLHDRSRRSRATHFDPSQFVDHYEVAVVEMLNKKQAGMPVSHEHAAPRPENAANLMGVAPPQHCPGKSRIHTPEKMAPTHGAAGRNAASHSGQESQGSRGKTGRTTKRSSEKGWLILWRVTKVQCRR
jgi:hypothetical protein